MPLPDALLALATVGTAQSAGDLPLSPAELGELLGQAGSPPEAQLLLQAAALALQEKAGRLPLRDERALPAASALDERPLVSPAAAGYLAQMLAGEHKEALPEWLAAARSRGLRPPEELLPHLLDQASQKAELCPLLFPLLGPRAVWLAGQAGFGPWAFMRLDAVAQVWEEAAAPVRVALLGHLRWRDPAQGRELLASTWSSEGARQREQFLRELEQGLGPDDETFLEAALDDRAAAVRRVAAAHLARLPGTAFVQRMASRAAALVSLQRGWRGARLALNEKVAVTDPSWTRDGLDVASPAGSRFSPAAWLLQQLLAFVPPAHWQQVWQLPPAELLEVARRAPEELSFLNRLAFASYRAGDHDFALLLIEEALPDLPPYALQLLAPVLPAGALDSALLLWLQRRAKAFSPEHPAFAALLAHRRRWDRALAEVVITAAGQTIDPADPYPDAEMQQLLKHVALHAPPADPAALVAGLEARARPLPRGGLKRLASEMQATLEYRRQMLQAFER